MKINLEEFREWGMFIMVFLTLVLMAVGIFFIKAYFIK